MYRVMQDSEGGVFSAIYLVAHRVGNISSSYFTVSSIEAFHRLFLSMLEA